MPTATTETQRRRNNERLRQRRAEIKADPELYEQYKARHRRNSQALRDSRRSEAFRDYEHSEAWLAQEAEDLARYGWKRAPRAPKPKYCILEGCEGLENQRGLCEAHYSKWRRGTYDGPILPNANHRSDVCHPGLPGLLRQRVLDFCGVDLECPYVPLPQYEDGDFKR